MFKLIVVLTLLTTAGAALSSPLEQSLTMKERLRISLWVEGLESSQPKQKAPNQKILPEEIERPLRKL